ncbi:MAG: hypothetical protein JWN48_2771 [Myxococcaceae bacterium]|nr:hypothetical protein [Myxococcaceae bacterium]
MARSTVRTRARSRVEPRASRITGLALGLALALLLALLGVGCAARQTPNTKTAALKTVVEPPTALVQVDEHFVGAARVLATRPAPLEPGKHRVTVEAPGYFPHDLEVDLVPGVTTLELKLRATPP